MGKFLVLFLIILNAKLAAQEITISTNPVSIINCIDNSSELTVNALSTSGKKLYYQWFKDSEKVNSATSPVLNFPSLEHNQSGLYFCRVSLDDGSESVDSRSASVYVLRSTSITNQPQDIRTNSEYGYLELNFEAHINGIPLEDFGENIKIQWYQVSENNIKLENGKIFTGVKTNNLNINIYYIPDTSYYYAEIEGKCGKVRTRTVTVIKNYEIKIEISPLESCDGNTESIKAIITNPQKHKMKFQWYKNNKPLYIKENLKGIYSDELIFEPISINDSGTYKIEASINDLNSVIYSNEVKVNINKKPELICFRADTLRINTDEQDKQQTRDDVTGWTKDVRLVIFYKYSTIPIQFDIYKNNLLISTQFSNESVWHLDDIYYLNFDVDRDDEANYWVIAHNACGNAFSDTVTVKTENTCDPYNQKQHLCEEERMYFQIDYIKPNDEIEFDYFWFNMRKNGAGGNVFKVPYSAGGLIREKNYLFSNNYEERFQNRHYFEVDNKSQIGLKVRNKDSTQGWESIFCCLDLYLEYVPIIKREPENRIIHNGDNDTLFNISFNNDEPYNLDIFFSIYYMPALDSKPKEVFTGVPEFGIYYYYVKDIDFNDDGYYFALAKHKNNCNPISTDTIKVTVIPKGIVSGVIGNELSSGIIVYPNPTSDFITIQTSEVLKTSEVYNVQIFDMLGIEVISTPSLRDTPQEGNIRIDVSNLTAGVYYIRIGDRVEKFVKM